MTVLSFEDCKQCWETTDNKQVLVYCMNTKQRSSENACTYSGLTLNQYGVASPQLKENDSLRTCSLSQPLL